MKTLRKIIEIDEELCDGCGQCVPSCAEGALEIVDGKAQIIADKLCDGLGACLGECPTGALKVIERKADEFDEEAVEEHLEEKAKETAKVKQQMPCGCPSTHIQTFVPIESHPKAQIPSAIGTDSKSALSHWPVQIRLIPPQAPFLKEANLLVLAYCVAVAYANLHKDFMNGKVVMMGCPKFDGADEYIEKFADLFKTAGIKSITTVYMEVPCCSGLPMIVKKGLEASGQTIPMNDVIVSTRGKLLEQTKIM
ncbi:MAG: 4Fe-4S dicluster domain-containing protein [Thermodesulfobacteriota bacterium]|nr:MAG: 4Fe-4S dicluster domain-containing protein [Thermodesulfobacteriota bacterium]